MKKTMLSTIALSILMLVLSMTMHGKDFEGVITYKIDFEGEDLTPQMEQMMPKMMMYYIKGNMAKSVINMGGMGKQIQIMDAGDKKIYNLFDMMGQKFYTVTASAEIEDKMEEEPEPTVEFIDETKEIAGYECKKAIVTVESNGQKNSFVVYYSPELGSKHLNFDNPYFNKIDGLLMQFEMMEGRFKMNVKAIEVDKKRIKDSEFEIPEEYQQKTKEEIRSTFGGGM